MRYTYFFFFLLLLCGAGFVRAAEDIHLIPLANNAEDLYWISFSGDDDEDSIFIMQINAKGKVTIQPKEVLAVDRLGGERGATAIGHNGKNKLNLWVWGEDEILYRAMFSKDGLRLLNKKKVPAVEVDDNDALQVTQKQGGNVLLAETDTGDLFLYPLNSRGLPGNGINLVAGVPRSNDEATISPDGLVVLTIRSP